MRNVNQPVAQANMRVTHYHFDGCAGLTRTIKPHAISYRPGVTVINICTVPSLRRLDVIYQSHRLIGLLLCMIPRTGTFVYNAPAGRIRYRCRPTATHLREEGILRIFRAWRWKVVHPSSTQLRGGRPRNSTRRASGKRPATRVRLIPRSTAGSRAHDTASDVDLQREWRHAVQRRGG